MGKRGANDAGIDMQAKKEELNGDQFTDNTGAATLAFGGGFQRADEAELKTRKILRINRSKYSGGSSGGGSNACAKAGSSLFAGIDLAAPAAKAPTGGVFGGVNLTAGSRSSDISSSLVPPKNVGGMFGSSPATSSLSSSSSLFGSSAKKPDLFGNGDKTMSSSTRSDAFVVGGGGSSLFSSSSAKTESSKSFPPAPAPIMTTSSTLLSSSSANGISNHSEEYLRNIAALNASFGSWVSEQMAKDDSKPLTQGVKNYIGYAKKQFEDVKQGISKSSTTNGSSSTGGVFSNVASSTGTSASRSDMFGGLSSGLGGSSNLFGGSSSSSAFGGGSTAAPATTEEDDNAPLPADEETNIQSNLETGETEVFKERAKVFALINSEWKSKGLGNLCLIKTTKGGPGYLVLRSDAGRALATVPVFEGMHPKASSVGNSHFVEFAAVSYGADDTTGEPKAENDGDVVPFKIKIKNGTQADSLVAKIKHLKD